MNAKGSDIFGIVSIGCVDEVKSLLSQGTDINVLNEVGASLLHLAAFNNRADMIDLLVSHGITLNQVTSDTGQLAIHWAAAGNSVSALYKLIQHGCHATAQDSSGKTVAHIAAEHSAIEVLHYLEREGLLTSARDHKGYHVLHWAVVAETMNSLRYLSALFDANVTSNTGLTPLHLAAGLGKVEAVQFLTAVDSCVMDGIDAKQRTASDVAAENNQHAAREVLRQARSQQPLRATTAALGTQVQYLGWFLLPLLAPLVVYLFATAQWQWCGTVLLVLIGAQLTGVLPYLLTRCEYCVSGAAAALWLYIVLPHGLFYALDTSVLVTLTALRVLIAALYIYCAVSAPSRVEQDEVPLSQHHAIDERKVCATCRTTIPLRAKHCRVTNKCVPRFDHYCVWIANAVGAHNHVPFIAFLLAVLLNNIISAVISVAGLLTLYNTAPSLYDFFCALESYGHLMLIGVNSTMFWWLAVLFKAQMHGVIYNITFNELLHWRKYKYMQIDGKFHNPFDAGSKWENMRNFLFNRPYNYEKEFGAELQFKNNDACCRNH